MSPPGCFCSNRLSTDTLWSQLHKVAYNAQYVQIWEMQTPQDTPEFLWESVEYKSELETNFEVSQNIRKTFVSEDRW